MSDGHGDFSWDDVEKFQEIAHALEHGESLETLAARLGLESPRMLKLRLERLEKALGLTGKGLVERRKYEKDARLSEAGRRMLEFAHRLVALREDIRASFAGGSRPSLRVATNLPTLMILAPEVVKELTEVRRTDGRGSDLGFRPEFAMVDDYAEALRRVSEGIVDLALFGRTPVDRQMVLPRQIELEVLIASEVAAFVPDNHALLARCPTGLMLQDLRREHIVARPFFRFLFPTEEPEGGWTPVTDFGDVPTYVRSGIGIGLNTHFGSHILNEIEQSRPLAAGDIVEVPFQRVTKIEICLIRLEASKRWRDIGVDAERYLEALRAFYQRKRAALSQAVVPH